MVLDIFWMQLPKLKKLICKSVGQNLKQVSLTKSFSALAMAFNLLLSNIIKLPLQKLNNIFFSETGRYIFQLAIKSCELEPSCETFLSVAQGWQEYFQLDFLLLFIFKRLTWTFLDAYHFKGSVAVARGNNSDCLTFIFFAANVSKITKVTTLANYKTQEQT